MHTQYNVVTLAYRNLINNCCTNNKGWWMLDKCCNCIDYFINDCCIWFVVLTIFEVILIPVKCHLYNF